MQLWLLPLPHMPLAPNLPPSDEHSCPGGVWGQLGANEAQNELIRHKKIHFRPRLLPAALGACGGQLGANEAQNELVRHKKIHFRPRLLPAAPHTPPGTIRWWCCCCAIVGGGGVAAAAAAAAAATLPL